MDHVSVGYFGHEPVMIRYDMTWFLSPLGMMIFLECVWIKDLRGIFGRRKKEGKKMNIIEAKNFHFHYLFSPPP